MGPPRLPRAYVEQLIPILATLPVFVERGATGRLDFLNAAHVPTGWLDWLDWRQPPQTVATHLLGSAANLVPDYDGPRAGCTPLGGILAEMMSAPTMQPANRAFMAALIVRYHLLPLTRPDFTLPPLVQTAIAALPPQDAPIWDRKPGDPPG